MKIVINLYCSNFDFLHVYYAMDPQYYMRNKNIAFLMLIIILKKLMKIAKRNISGNKNKY